jgi:hypothetical protein
MNHREQARWVVGGGVVAALIGIGGCFLWMNRGALTRSSDIHFQHPERAVREARSLIAAKREHPSSFGDFTEPDRLPASLRIEGLRYAKVHSDHVDLVMARNPDISIGARVWAVQHRPHRDEPTRYAEIWFYRYDNEAPETVSNIP